MGAYLWYLAVMYDHNAHSTFGMHEISSGL